MTPDTKRLAIAGVAIFFFLGATQSLYGPLVPSLRAQFALNSSTVGLLFAAHGTGELLGVLAPALLPTRAQLARIPLTAATLLLVVGAGAFAIAASWLALIGAAFVFALGFGIHVGRLNELFVKGFGERSASMSQFINAGFSIGSILGPLAVAQWSQVSRDLFLVVAVLSALLLPVAWMLDRRHAHATGSTMAQRATQPARSGMIFGFVIVMLLTVGVESCVGAWTTSLALERGVEQASAARFTSWFFAAVFAGRMIVALIGKQWNAARSVIIAIVVLDVLLLAAALIPGPPVFFAATGLAIAPIFSATLVWLTRSAPNVRQASAIVIAGAILGSAVFPPLVGVVMDQVGTRAAIPFILLIGVAALLAALRLVQLTAPLTPSQ